MITICRGIPGGSGLHRVSDPDELIAGICSACQASLFAAKGWGSQSNGEGTAESVIALRVAGGKKSAKNMNNRPAGRAFRNYPDKRKQPWGWERE